MSEDFAYPFSGIVGQFRMKLALLAVTVNPLIGGLLIRGCRGTAKTTAVRSLESVLPKQDVMQGCLMNCDPNNAIGQCKDCRGGEAADRISIKEKTKVIELPLNASEDRVAGSVNIRDALCGEIRFEPGVLARSNRAILYVDEVNLLDDHIVDIILDASATGVNIVEREGVSVKHPAGFVLIGTMNPEEGDLRPQLEDRFGICVDVPAELEGGARTEIMKRRIDYERDRRAFVGRYAEREKRISNLIEEAREGLKKVVIDDHILELISELSSLFNVESHRADISMLNTSLALAALEGRKTIDHHHIATAAKLALVHRLRRSPMDDSGCISETRIDSAVEEDRAKREKPQTRKLTKTGFGVRGFQDEVESFSAEEGEKANTESCSQGRAHSESNNKNESEESRERCLFEVRGGEDRLWQSLKRDGLQVQVENGDSSKSSSGGKMQSEKEGLSKITTESTDMFPQIKTSGRKDPSNGKRVKNSVSAKSGKTVSSRKPRAEEALKIENIDIGASIRTAAANQSMDKGKVNVKSEDAVMRIRRKKSGATILFVVDASASMSANSRIDVAKEAVFRLLGDAYKKRDRVGMIIFRDKGAEEVLMPTGSVSLARMKLKGIEPGGATPLTHGLSMALNVIKRELRKHPDSEPVIALFTDGFGNVSLFSDNPLRESILMAHKIRDEGIASILFDISHEGGSLRRYHAKKISDGLGGRYVRMKGFEAEEVIDNINGAPILT